jgi:hypothetical protein
MMLSYAIVLVGGVVGGFLIVPRSRPIVVLFAAGVVLLVLALILTKSWSLDASTVFLLAEEPPLARPGVKQLVATGYAAIIGAGIAALRSTFSRNRST